MTHEQIERLEKAAKRATNTLWHVRECFEAKQEEDLMRLLTEDAGGETARQHITEAFDGKRVARANEPLRAIYELGELWREVHGARGYTHVTHSGQACRVVVSEPDTNGMIIVINEDGVYMRHNKNTLKEKPRREPISRATYNALLSLLHTPA